MKTKMVFISLLSVGTITIVLFSNLHINRPTGLGTSAAHGQTEGSGSLLPAGTRANPLSIYSIQQGLSSVVASIRPKVVRISSRSEAGANQQHVGMQFLDPFYSGNSWIGSGVIIHPEGYILTSRQVVSDIPLAHITLFRAGTSTLPAYRVASDDRSDLVLLKISQGNNYPYAVLEDFSRVRVGDLVVALGSPFGLSETVTHGIVSTTKRDIVIDNNTFRDVIQTDAAINRGNAGGPLVNIFSKVIGINIAIYSTNTTFAGIGFAVSSGSARTFLDSVLGVHP